MLTMLLDARLFLAPIGPAPQVNTFFSYFSPLPSAPVTYKIADKTKESPRRRYRYWNMGDVGIHSFSPAQADS